METFKTGDPVEFDHMGNKKEGTVLDVLGDGKVRIKDTRGYQYRYQPENVFRPGTMPKLEAAPAPQKQETQSINTNNQNQPPMAKTNGKGSKADAVATPSAASADQKKKIQSLTCKKHQRIFLLIDAGCEKEEIMKLASCNAGEISNVRKQYLDPAKAETAKALLA